MKQCLWAGLDLGTPKVMGILNVTPDSFSDGGLYDIAFNAIARGKAMVAAGVDIIDIGGESTRPGAAIVPVDEEIARVVPVIKPLAAAGALISIDTRNAATMAAALDAGAVIVNDVSGLRHDKDAATLVANRGCPVVLMHMRGSPDTMNCQAHYANLVPEVLAELMSIRDAAMKAGVTAQNIALDPGLGFAKIGAQNLELLRATGNFAALGHALVIGGSRKRFIGEFGEEAEPARRLAGSLAVGLFALGQGAHILRVHDAEETMQAVKLWRELTKHAAGSAKVA
jgi:dihydropteroate synthase